MYTRQTVLMAAGLALVAMNAVVAGHWLNLKSSVVNAAGSPAPTLKLPTPASLASDAANAIGNRIKSQAKQQIADPIAGAGKAIVPKVGNTSGVPSWLRLP